MPGLYEALLGARSAQPRQPTATPKPPSTDGGLFSSADNSQALQNMNSGAITDPKHNSAAPTVYGPNTYPGWDTLPTTLSQDLYNSRNRENLNHYFPESQQKEILQNRFLENRSFDGGRESSLMSGEIKDRPYPINYDSLLEHRLNRIPSNTQYPLEILPSENQDFSVDKIPPFSNNSNNQLYQALAFGRKRQEPPQDEEDPFKKFNKDIKVEPGNPGAASIKKAFS